MIPLVGSRGCAQLKEADVFPNKVDLVAGFYTMFQRAGIGGGLAAESPGSSSSGPAVPSASGADSAQFPQPPTAEIRIQNA